MFGLALLFVYVFLLSFQHFDHLAWGRGSWSLCSSCIYLLAMHTLICVTFSLPSGVRGCLPVALPDFSVYLFIHLFFVWEFLTKLNEDVWVAKIMHYLWCLSSYMLFSSLCIVIIVILLKIKPQEAILPQNQHIKSWRKIKRISDLPTLICFGMFVETRVFCRPHLNAHVVNRHCAKRGWPSQNY